MFMNDFQLTPEEQKNVVTAFQNPDKTQAEGVKLAGQKFFTLQAEPERIYGKKAVRVVSIGHIPLLY